MTIKEQLEAVNRANGSPPARRIRLRDFDGHSMVVKLRKGGRQIALRGTARFVRDDDIGNSLQITIDDDSSGRPVLILSESEWNGRIVPDFHHGCDFCVVIS